MASETTLPTAEDVTRWEAAFYETRKRALKVMAIWDAARGEGHGRDWDEDFVVVLFFNGRVSVGVGEDHFEVPRWMLTATDEQIAERGDLERRRDRVHAHNHAVRQQINAITTLGEHLSRREREALNAKVFAKLNTKTPWVSSHMPPAEFEAWKAANKEAIDGWK